MIANHHLQPLKLIDLPGDLQAQRATFGVQEAGAKRQFDLAAGFSETGGHLVAKCLQSRCKYRLARGVVMVPVLAGMGVS